MIPRYNAITSYLAPWETHFVEPVVFGTTDPYHIACLLDAFCRRELGAALADVLFYESSIGAVCGMRLQDGRRLVVKVHQPTHTLEFLQAVVRVQHYLLAHDYPCTKPLFDPRPLAHGLATVEEFIDEGEYRQAQDPAVRRSMAQMLARLIQLTKTPGAIPGVQPALFDRRLPAGAVWPTPHSKLFDFEATAARAEWIDEIARHAQKIKLNGAGQLVLGHTDWGVKHFRFVGEQVRVIYDWDSLILEKEPVIVGHASAYFTYTEFFGENLLPTDEEAQAFVAEYEATRGRPFTSEERQTLEAARIYSVAYGARCEHALYPEETTYPAGSYRSKLVNAKIP